MDDVGETAKTEEILHYDSRSLLTRLIGLMFAFLVSPLFIVVGAAFKRFWNWWFSIGFLWEKTLKLRRRYEPFLPYSSLCE